MMRGPNLRRLHDKAIASVNDPEFKAKMRAFLIEVRNVSQRAITAVDRNDDEALGDAMAKLTALTGPLVVSEAIAERVVREAIEADKERN